MMEWNGLAHLDGQEGDAGPLVTEGHVDMMEWISIFFFLTLFFIIIFL